jgi:hypothetical protein
MKQSSPANQRKRRALRVLKQSALNSIPSSVHLVGFRAPTAAERAHGKSLTGRAAELLARKSRKLAVSR